jgi:hypothetical protein
VAVDPFFQDTLTNRRKQLLDVLEAVEDPGYAPVVAEMLGELDFERGFFVLQNCVVPLRSSGEWDAVFAVFKERHGAKADLAAVTFEEILRRDALVAMRATVTGVEHRFFLALLLNVPRGGDILRFVGDRYPGSAEGTVRRWMAEIEEAGDDESGLVALTLRQVGLGGLS